MSSPPVQFAGNGLLTPEQIAAIGLAASGEVWTAPRGAFIAPGSFGEAINLMMFGTMRELVVPNPVAGADWTQTAGPFGERWLVQAIFCRLTTSATAANRAPTITIDRAGVVQAGSIGATLGAQVASNSLNYLVASSASALVTAGNTALGQASGGFTRVVGFTLPFLAQPGDVIHVVTGNLQAGDQWSTISIFYQQLSL